MHIPGIINYRRSRLHSPHAKHGRPGAVDAEAEHVALTERASSSGSSLVIRNVPDDTENDEQT